MIEGKSHTLQEATKTENSDQLKKAMIKKCGYGNLGSIGKIINVCYVEFLGSVLIPKSAMLFYPTVVILFVVSFVVEKNEMSFFSELCGSKKRS